MENDEKVILDVIAFAVAFGGLIVTWMPFLASLSAFVYGLIRIYETPTVQKWLNK